MAKEGRALCSSLLGWQRANAFAVASSIPPAAPVTSAISLRMRVHIVFQVLSVCMIFLGYNATKRADGLEVDHDDSHAYASVKSFALLLHGSQRKETLAAKATSSLRKSG